jgi:hypothetical protein
MSFNPDNSDLESEIVREREHEIEQDTARHLAQEGPDEPAPRSGLVSRVRSALRSLGGRSGRS